MVYEHHREEELSRIVIAYLPRPNSPQLLIGLNMRHHLDVEQIFAVGDADNDGAGDQSEHKHLACGRCSKSRG